MKLSRKSFLTILSLAAGAMAFSGVVSDAAAQAARAGYRWEKHKAANVMFEIPNAWTTNVEGDTIVTKPKDGGLVMEFFAIDHGQKEAQEVGKAIEREILKRIPDAKLTEAAKPITQNGLNGTLIKGEGHKKGTSVKNEFFAFILGDGKGHGLMGVAFAGVGQLASHKTAVNEILSSIRPMK